MSHDYSTRKVQATEHATDWKSDPIDLGPYSLYGRSTFRGEGTGVPGSPPAPGGRSEGPPVVYSDPGPIRASLELVLARLLARERELSDIRDSLRVCENGIAQLLSARQTEHLPLTESELLDLRARANELDLRSGPEAQPGRASGVNKNTTHWGEALYGDGWAYNPRSKGADQ